MVKNHIEYHWDFDGKEIIKKDNFCDIAKNVIHELELTLDHVALIFVNDEYLKKLHGKYLDDLSTTDVMTFDLRDEDSLDSEIYLSVDTAKKVADELKISVEEELLRYMLHGILHLAGYDDHSDEERKQMKVVENRLVEKYSEKLV